MNHQSINQKVLQHTSFPKIFKMVSCPISAALLMCSCVLQSAAAYVFFPGHQYNMDRIALFPDASPILPDDTLLYGEMDDTPLYEEIQSGTDTRTSPANFLGHQYNMDRIALFPDASPIPPDDTLLYGEMDDIDDTPL